jgi:ATP-binding cassette subfamily C (CFTR/MRP) protein 1
MMFSLQVKWSVYSHYLRSIGLFLSGATIFFNLVFQSFSIGSNVWLSEWSNDGNIYVNETVNESKRDLYLGVYGALGAGQGKSYCSHLSAILSGVYFIVIVI